MLRRTNHICSSFPLDQSKTGLFVGGSSVRRKLPQRIFLELQCERIGLSRGGNVWQICDLRRRAWRLQSSLVNEKACQYQPGQNIHGFTVKEVVGVPDLFITAVKLTHDQTGAQYLHAARDDSNNLFSVQFRTTPLDNTGVPHILEHTVLCGSKRYPCRDPFFKMLDRSLSTFMNAFTANDYTMYPFSTQNGKDFQNLLSVYLDAVFFPILREQDFCQEGWRLEHEDPTDLNSPLMFKGVVFNEMKGAFSDNERVYAQHLQNKLYPEHTYSVVAGGEPLAIPDLTWEQLKEFHATHYHPSNARFFTYGDLPLEQHLEQIQEEALSKFDRVTANTEVPPQSLWSSPREAHVTCSPDALAPDPARQHRLCVSYLLGDITDTFEGFTLNLLSSLMISGPNSPFYKALIEPEIGSDYSSVVGYDGSTREASFRVGLQGMAEEDAEKVKQIISQTIDDIVETGFPEERIDALLHEIEIGLKHQSANFGLSLASFIASSWNHGGDPVELLQINDSVDKFREALKENPRFLQDKVKHYFKENPHRLTLSMSPDEAYLEKQAKAEEEKLQKKINALSEGDRKEIYEKGLQLLAAQSCPPDASSLPSLKVSDIAPTVPVTPVQIGTAGGVPVQYCEQPTNGLVYFRAFCSLNTLPEDVKLHVPLFCNVITNPHFKDEERMRALVKMSAQELANGISYSGHMYAMTRAGRHLTPAAELNEAFDGMEQVKFMKSIAETSDLSRVIRMLPRIKKHLLNPANMRCAINTTPQNMSDSSAQLESFMKEVAVNSKVRRPVRTNIIEVSYQTGPTIKAEYNFKPCQMKTIFQLPFPVNFVSEAIRTVPFSHEDNASLRILGRMMTSKFLHGEIREKGGAYGGGARMSGGLFSFYSYRDPTPVQTLSVFRRGVDWAKSGQFSQQDIDEAKMSVFSSVDSPVSPANKGLDGFLTGVTDEMLQDHRERLFAASHRSLVEVAERYLGAGQRTCGVAVLGPGSETIKKDPSWIKK
uniref:Presequence protease, mitochondrial n=1 Tax=Gasterosteus aculeatus aculeatus TaxID=481459 RepID=A0AAQ4Q688_GASAC